MEMIDEVFLPSIRTSHESRFDSIHESDEELKKIVLGVCVMEKKARSSPMTAILDRLRAFGEFEILIFGDKVILEEPVENWPVCDALIAFHSTGFPLAKARQYVLLRKPYLVNELEPQWLLHDRRKVYAKLEEHGLLTPNYAVVNRSSEGEAVEGFEEEEDYVVIRGRKMNKPFVEKPVDGDDHSVMIYYPSSAGGGMKELFRKVGNRSSSFHPEVRNVRRQGSYIYEEFLPTGGTDVKVYTVGPDYAHAEARKSPVVDGVVMRSADGKEIRYPVLLTPTEKEMARVVCLAFGQAVCGFDLLRSHGRSFVCDVNGWSFVKNSVKYYDDAACVLRGMLLRAVAPHLYSPLPSSLPWNVPGTAPSSHLDGSTSPDYDRQHSASHSGHHTFGAKEELRCVIAVIRHGDRTPKQKVKLVVTQEQLLRLMLKYNGNRPRAEAKLKSAVQLQDLLDALRRLLPKHKHGSDSETDDSEISEKLRHVKAVLEEGGHFSGIYRKAQLKPQKWVTEVHRLPDGAEVEVEKPVEAMMVLKYGGVLTHAGRKQAEQLGRWFREKMYPDEPGSEGSGLIRLHSTYRHDLKIYSSDEGRVQMSAAAFAKGLLDLEGPLTPILVSLVSKDSPMLDGLDNASIEMEHVKKRLAQIMTTDDPVLDPPCAGDPPWMTDAAWVPAQPLTKLRQLVGLVKSVAAQAKERCMDDEQADEDSQAAVEEAVKKLRIVPYEAAAGKHLGPRRGSTAESERNLGKPLFDERRIAAGLPCGTENFLLIFARWKKLERDFYNPRKDRFDISKIPDIYDSAKYDLLHNRHLHLIGLDDLFLLAKDLASAVIPNEYGINPSNKLTIGSKVTRRLLGKLLIDFTNTQDEALAVGRAMQRHRKSMREQRAAAAAAAAVKFSEDQRNAHLRRSSGDYACHSDNDDDDGDASYRLDPHYAKVRTPQRHVRTRLYFTSESHIHSLVNVLRFCSLGACDGMEGHVRARGSHNTSEGGTEGHVRPLLSQAAMEKLFEARELDYLTHIVLRMYENVEVSLSDPQRFRFEILFSPGSAYNPLEVQPIHNDHTLPVMPPEPMQNDDPEALTFKRLQKLLRPFAMPREDFPPPAQPQGFTGFFRSGGVFDRIANMWPFGKGSGASTASTPSGSGKFSLIGSSSDGSEGNKSSAKLITAISASTADLSGKEKKDHDASKEKRSMPSSTSVPFFAHPS